MCRHAHTECAPKYMLTLTGAPKRTFIYAVMHAFTRLCTHVSAHTHTSPNVPVFCLNILWV